MIWFQKQNQYSISSVLILFTANFILFLLFLVQFHSALYFCNFDSSFCVVCVRVSRVSGLHCRLASSLMYFGFCSWIHEMDIFYFVIWFRFKWGIQFYMAVIYAYYPLPYFFRLLNVIIFKLIYVCGWNYLHTSSLILISFLQG